MNSRPFDRNSVERYIHNGFLIEDFLEKYEFDSEDDFRDNLIRIFSDTGKVDRMLQDMRKKAKKENKRKKKSNATVNTAAALNIQNPAFVPVQGSNLSVPYNAIQIPSLVDGIKNKPLENLKVNPLSLSSTKEGSDVNPLDELKSSLAKNQEYLSEIETNISNLFNQRDRILKDLSESREQLEILIQKADEEKKHVEDLFSEFKICEGQLAEASELKQITDEEIKKIETSIRSLEVKKLYFGPNFNESYDYDSTKFEVSNEEVMAKMTQLLLSGTYEDFAVSTLRKLSKVLCIIEKAKAEDDNIEVCFDSEEADIVDEVKKMTDLNVLVIE